MEFSLIVRSWAASKRLRTSVITGHGMPDILEIPAYIQSVISEDTSISLCPQGAISCQFAGITYGFAILGNCSVFLQVKLVAVDRKTRSDSYRRREKRGRWWWPRPWRRKEKGPKDVRGS